MSWGTLAVCGFVLWCVVIAVEWWLCCRSAGVAVDPELAGSVGPVPGRGASPSPLGDAPTIATGGPVAASGLPVCAMLQPDWPINLAYRCTMPAGHDGNHWATDDKGRPLDWWPA